MWMLLCQSLRNWRRNWRGRCVVLPEVERGIKIVEREITSRSFLSCSYCSSICLINESLSFG